MIMKKAFHFAILIAFGVLSASSQQLQNTLWKGYWKPTQDSLLIDSKVDSAYVNSLTGFNLASSRYWEVQDTFYMVDAYGPISCPSTDTGMYLFQIINDSLFFYLINDPCASRSSGLDSMGLKKQTTLSVQSFEDDLAIYYPNPVVDDLYLQFNRTTNQLQIRIFDVNGKLVEQQQTGLVGRMSLSFSNYQVGIYFVELSDGEQQQMIKIQKIRNP